MGAALAATDLTTYLVQCLWERLLPSTGDNKPLPQVLIDGRAMCYPVCL